MNYSANEKKKEAMILDEEKIVSVPSTTSVRVSRRYCDAASPIYATRTSS